MSRRGKVAALLVVLGGVLAAVGSAQDMFRAGQASRGDEMAYVRSLWGVRAPGTDFVDVQTAMNAGVAVVFTAVLMVVAVAFTLRRGKVGRNGRVATLATVSVFVGVVLAYVVGVVREEETVRSIEGQTLSTYAVSYLPGWYLLVASAVVALIGAVLAQRTEPVEVGNG